MMTDWQVAQRWEKVWWAACANTFGEEEKQLLYAKRMGLEFFHDGRSPYNFDLCGKAVIDIGGGACSLLLKCVNVRGTVVDPILEKLPNWVQARYDHVNVQTYPNLAGEDLPDWFDFDEVWIYNTLQHVKDPEAVIENARQAGKLIRLFEWVDTPVNEGHLHSLSEVQLNEWLGGEGRIEELNGEANCHGRCYYGVFPT